MDEHCRANLPGETAAGAGPGTGGAAGAAEHPLHAAPETLRPWCSDVCAGHIEGRVDDQGRAR
jgi:hypothetical protein